MDGSVLGGLVGIGVALGDGLGTSVAASTLCRGVKVDGASSEQPASIPADAASAERLMTLRSDRCAEICIVECPEVPVRCPP